MSARSRIVDASLILAAIAPMSHEITEFLCWYTNRTRGTAMYDARSVANDLLRRAGDKHSLDSPQLQKLVYFCHAWLLGLYQRPLLKQPVKAWRYGPVVPELHRSLAHYGTDPVDELIPGFPPPEYDDDEESIVSQVMAKYGRLSGARLMMLTHKPGSPWYWTYFSPDYGPTAVIPNSLIEQYHAKVAEVK